MARCAAVARVVLHECTPTRRYSRFIAPSACCDGGGRIKDQ